MSICHDSALLPRCASVPAYCSEKHVRFFILPGRFSHTADTGRDTGTDRGRIPGSHPEWSARHRFAPAVRRRITAADGIAILPDREG